jgi:hypothetical protein
LDREGGVMGEETVKMVPRVSGVMGELKRVESNMGERKEWMPLMWR